MPFFAVTPESERLGKTLVAWALEQFGTEGLDAEGFALTLIPFATPLASSAADEPPTGFSTAEICPSTPAAW